MDGKKFFFELMLALQCSLAHIYTQRYPHADMKLLFRLTESDRCHSAFIAAVVAAACGQTQMRLKVE